MVCNVCSVESIVEFLAALGSGVTWLGSYGELPRSGAQGECLHCNCLAPWGSQGGQLVTFCIPGGILSGKVYARTCFTFLWIPNIFFNLIGDGDDDGDDNEEDCDDDGLTMVMMTMVMVMVMMMMTTTMMIIIIMMMMINDD